MTLERIEDEAIKAEYQKRLVDLFTGPRFCGDDRETDFVAGDPNQFGAREGDGPLWFRSGVVPQEDGIKRHWNAFGLAAAGDAPPLRIAIEVNIPIGGNDNRIGGCFAADERGTWLVRQGIFGGLQPIQDVAAFANFADWQLSDLLRGNGTIVPAVRVARLDNCVNSIAQIRYFTERMSAFRKFVRG